MPELALTEPRRQCGADDREASSAILRKQPARHQRRPRIGALLLLSALNLSAQHPPRDFHTRLRALIESRFPGTLCPGFSVAIARNNAIVYSQALGSADLEQKIPLRVDSVYRLASVSKPVTGTIVMDLIQTGRLRLDALVRTYLPELPATYSKVTVQRLLAHQAGVRAYRDDEEVFSTTHYATSREALKAFATDPLLFDPGTRVEYSSFGFTVLGAVAEVVTGKPFQALARDFFTRHRIQGFDIDDPRALVPQRVRGYLIDKHGTPRNARFYDPSNKYPAGGFTASAELSSVCHRCRRRTGATARRSRSDLDRSDDGPRREEFVRIGVGSCGAART